jgi:hypothetical protein
VRSLQVGVALAAALFGVACPSQPSDREESHRDYGNGGQAALTGSALLNLLRAREFGGDYDTAILEVLRIQCRGVALPPNVSFRKEDISRFLPLEHLKDASLAFCGSFVLADGTSVMGPAFKGGGK